MVVSFLRPRGALGVLEGAAILTDEGSLSAVTGGVYFEQRCAAPDFHTQQLYLGSGEICPAAEGWASRVLAMARGLDGQYYLEIDDHGVMIAELGNPENGAGWESWGWNKRIDSPQTDGYGKPELPGLPPSTPAERLAAVLAYELERVR